MSYVEIMTQLSQYVSEKALFREALSHIGSGREIRILIEDRQEAALFLRDGKACLEARPAQHPDVEFSLSPEAIRVLLEDPAEDMASFGISVVKQVLVGQIRIRVCGSIFSVLTGGYLNLIKAAGPEFLRFLGTQGFGQISKLVALIKSMKS